ncbi:hypothetical protein [Thermocatellispora tengchongensis]|uniref:hypothetical protein n=1 Tax=Thermocatellispora tengchongensis TaxID=1073253 RepID=UPI00362FDCC3
MRFASPFAVPTPPGAEGWESMYPYYALLSEDRRKDEDARFWFFDGMHNPEPLYPFDTIATENWWVAVSQMSTRVWPIPLAGGIDHRIVNGYLYVSPTAVTDQEQIAARARHFAERAGHYYENWDEIYAGWEAKARDCIERLKAIDFAPLPDLEPLESVTGGRGLYSSYDLLTRYTTLINNFFEMGSYHFEMLNLGYGAYLTFREFCQAAFPGISDQTIASMVSGIDIMLFRPDDEVRKLAALAVELGLDRALLSSEDPDEALAAVAGAGDPGARWLAAFEAAKDPWFWFSTGAGYQHSDRAWIDDLRLPFRALRGYIAACAPARTSAARLRRSPRSARGSPPSTAPTCPPTRTARASTGWSHWPGRCSRSSRTTTSTSSTGTTRCSGARCARSAGSSWPMASSTTRRTSSTCTARRCSRPCTTSSSAGGPASSRAA